MKKRLNVILERLLLASEPSSQGQINDHLNASNTTYVGGETLLPPSDPFARVRKRPEPTHARSASSLSHDNFGLDYFILWESADPKWFDLFQECFLRRAAVHLFPGTATTASHQLNDNENHDQEDDEDHDDLLFFTRHSSILEEGMDAIFVKRRIGPTLPPLPDMVSWKETFFLNLISQIPCTLIVSVCSKVTPVQLSTIKLGVLSDGNNTSTSQGNTLTVNPKPSSKMITRKRIIKKVYATPYKCRMDVKEAPMNEVSYPLVYYSVNDYESDDLHVTIKSGEYLCAEVSILLPCQESKPKDSNDKKDKESCTSSPSSSPSPPPSSSRLDPNEILRRISVVEDSSPFPTPPAMSKITLFQGAVPYRSLAEVFAQKQSQVSVHRQRSSGATSSPRSPSSEGRGGGRSSPPSHQPTLRTEYILMRGPQGKGQCQVAICDADSVAALQPFGGGEAKSGSIASSSVSNASATTTATFSSASTAGGMTFTDRLRIVGSFIQKVSGWTNGSNSNNPASSTLTGNSLSALPLLDCSITYVCVPWQSITKDMLDFGVEKLMGGDHGDV